MYTICKLGLDANDHIIAGLEDDLAAFDDEDGAFDYVDAHRFEFKEYHVKGCAYTEIVIEKRIDGECVGRVYEELL